LDSFKFQKFGFVLLFLFGLGKFGGLLITDSKRFFDLSLSIRFGLWFRPLGESEQGPLHQ
jgi:hypothetical protein